MGGERELLERRMGDVEVRAYTLDAFHRRRRRSRRRRRIATSLAGMVLVAAVAGGVLAAVGADRDQGTPTNVHAGPVDVPSPFLGAWTSTDSDGSSQTMEIRPAAGDDLEIVIHDDVAQVCSATASTMTGTGQTGADDELVVPRPSLVCDNGSTPGQVANLTFVPDPAGRGLFDSLGVVWGRPSTAAGGQQERRGVLVDPPEAVERMTDAVEAGDVEGFVDVFAADGLFSPRGSFEEAMPTSELGDKLGIGETPLVGAWFATNDAWEVEADLRSCTRLTVPLFGVAEGVDRVFECRVAVRWRTLSLEIEEGWDFELRGDELVWWGASANPRQLELLDLDPAERTMSIGYAGLEAWEDWLVANHPDDAAAWLVPRDREAAVASEIADPEQAPRVAPLLAPALRSWVIDGHRFTPFGLVPYDPAFADQIGASILEYLAEG